jgi:hypothetical protein
MPDGSPLDSYLKQYGLLGEGHHYQYNLSQSERRSTGPRKRNFIPFMLSLVPPTEYPSGEMKTRKIPAPQQIKTRLTSVGDNGNIVALRDREEGSNPSGLTGITEGTTPEEASEPGGGFSRQDGSSAQGSNPETEGVIEGTGIDPIVETEYSVSNLESESEEGVGFTEYLSSLEERYKTLEEQSELAENKIEEENTEQVKGREFVDEDDTKKWAEAIREARSIGETEEFIRRQALLMKNLPPLLMYINPNDMSISYDQMVSETKTRDGHVVEHWGMEQPSLSGSGEIGAFYVDKEDEGGGLTEVHRRESAAFQNFMNMFMVYRNNGYIYNPSHRISRVGSVRIFYDNKMYVGSFDDFSINESEEKPFSIEYDFSFTVRYEKEF